MQVDIDFQAYNSVIVYTGKCVLLNFLSNSCSRSYSEKLLSETGILLYNISTATPIINIPIYRFTVLPQAQAYYRHSALPTCNFRWTDRAITLLGNGAVSTVWYPQNSYHKSSLCIVLYHQSTRQSNEVVKCHGMANS